MTPQFHRSIELGYFHGAASRHSPIGRSSSPERKRECFPCSGAPDDEVGLDGGRTRVANAQPRLQLERAPEAEGSRSKTDLRVAKLDGNDKRFAAARGDRNQAATIDCWLKAAFALTPPSSPRFQPLGPQLAIRTDEGRHPRIADQL